jgi:glycosyltransferase involved in cell wall biosynthesis
MTTAKILVVGNYLDDQQQSMIRFAELLVRIYENHSLVCLAHPPAIVNRIPWLPRLVRKYLAYVDKLILFPVWLLFNARDFDLVHIADHGNAYYSYCFPRRLSCVTCHDLLAVRAAFGDPDIACQLSPVGLWLQLIIMAGLRRAGAVVFVSHASFADFKRLIGELPRQRYAVIPNSLNAPFKPISSSYRLTNFEQSLLPAHPYLLMVGSSHPRKNRLLALQLLEKLGESSLYSLVFAGDQLTRAEHAFQSYHLLGSRLLSIPGPSHALLNQLYCEAHALLFPSFSEGFGWPLVEAQACCCPVIASPTTSIPEVAGEGALYADPSDVDTFAKHVLALENPVERTKLINKGVTNSKRFNFQEVSESYRCFALIS